MRRRRLVSFGRMVAGYTLGIGGMATLSMGFVHLAGSEMLVGLCEVALATLATLGLMVPLRKRHRSVAPHRDSP